jgi:steroid delta-isomerase-like uncharacterized protein
MSAEHNKRIARRVFEEVWNEANFATADALVDPDYINHAPGLPGMPPGSEGLKYLVSTFRAAFPDLQMTVEDQIAEGDRVATRWTMRGTHTGAFLGIPPTGKAVASTGINIERIIDGTVVEHWRGSDELGLLQQLGVVPAPPAAS